jgi:hypothetical protein
MFATQTLWGHMRLFTLILAALLYFPTIASAELGPETKKLIRNFSTENELLYWGIVSRDCSFKSGVDADEITKQRLLLRRIRPIWYLNKDLHRLKIFTYVQCLFSQKNSVTLIEVDFKVRIGEDVADTISIGIRSGTTLRNYEDYEIEEVIKEIVDEKIAEFISAWMEVEDLGSQRSVKQF